MKNLRFSVLLLVFFLLFSVCSYAAPAQYNNFDNSKADQGTVGARYTPSSQNELRQGFRIALINMIMTFRTGNV